MLVAETLDTVLASARLAVQGIAVLVLLGTIVLEPLDTVEFTIAFEVVLVLGIVQLDLWGL